MVFKSVVISQHFFCVLLLVTKVIQIKKICKFGKFCVILCSSFMTKKKLTVINTVSKTVKRMKKTVAYYRVSTQRQGVSGLGLESQKQSVQSFVNQNKSEIVADFTEIESGKKNNRAQLMAALQLCKETGATLVIAKLDRLSRDLSFIAELQKSGIEFIACDMPSANKFTVQIMAAFAQHEREMISDRVKSSLKVAKERGKLIGNPQFRNAKKRDGVLLEYSLKGVESIKANARKNENNVRAISLIKEMRKNNSSWSEITQNLNKSNYKTAKGKSFQIVQVQRLAQRENIL